MSFQPQSDPVEPLIFLSDAFNPAVGIPNSITAQSALGYTLWRRYPLTHTLPELSDPMNKQPTVKSFILLACLLISTLSFTLPALAQTTIDPGDYLERYTDLEHSRTEDGGFVLGDPDAPITIVEFADFMCPHCQTYQATVGEFIDEFVATGQAKFEYRLFPVVSPELSPFTAQLAECAAEQDEALFWPVHDALYDLALARQIDLDDTGTVLAEAFDLDADALNTCTETAVQHETDTALADSVGVTGTPSILVRLDEETLAWPFIDGQRGGGGLPLDALELLVTAEDISEYVIVNEPLLDSLISGEPCDAPCWNGITPGKTTYEEGKEIIEGIRQFVNVNEQHAPQQDAILLSWMSFDGYECCQMYSETGELVDELFIINTSVLALGDVLEAADEPDSALALQTNEGDTIINLFYTDLNLILYVYVSRAIDELSEESDIVGASYVSAERMEALLDELQPSEWNGFEGLEGYFRAQ